MTVLGFLFIASVWALKIVILNHIDLFDAAVFGAMFVVYILHAAREAHEVPELIGPPMVIGALPVRKRRIVTVALFFARRRDRTVSSTGSTPSTDESVSSVDRPPGFFGMSPYDCGIYDGHNPACSMRGAGASLPLAISRDDLGWKFGSRHPGHCQFVYADGSVRSLSSHIDPVTLGLLAQRNDGQPIPDY